MSEYEVLPVQRFELGEVYTLEWVASGVMALHRMIFLVDTHVQGMRLRDLNCKLQLPGVRVQATCSELESPGDLSAIAGRYRVMAAGGRFDLTIPKRPYGWPVFEVSVLPICRLPPPCFEPKAGS